MPLPVVLPVSVSPDDRPVRPAQGPRILLGLLPLWLVVLLRFAAPDLLDPIFSNPPAILGMPVGVVVVSIALALMTIGLVGLRRVSSTSAAIAVFLAFTVPATLAIFLAPALVLVIENLAV